MAIRFRKSVKLAPGVRLNLGKKSAGVSVGGKYGGFSANTRTGVKARVSAPGTGLSYTTGGSSGSAREADTEDSGGQSSLAFKVIVVIIFVALFAWFGISVALKSHKDTPPAEQVAATPTETPDTSYIDDIRSFIASNYPDFQIDSSGGGAGDFIAHATYDTSVDSAPDDWENTVSTVAEIAKSAKSQFPEVNTSIQVQNTSGENLLTVTNGNVLYNVFAADEPPAQRTNFYVASKNSNIYHEPGCDVVDSIHDENRITFSFRERARAAGYSAHDCVR